MGTYSIVVNLTKRQYLCPAEFGELFTAPYVLDGHHAAVISLLVCDVGSLGGGSLAGCWHGDPIYLELASLSANPVGGKILLKNLGDILRAEELRGQLDFPEVLERALERQVGPDWETKSRSVDRA